MEVRRRAENDEKKERVGAALFLSLPCILSALPLPPLPSLRATAYSVKTARNRPLRRRHFALVECADPTRFINRSPVFKLKILFIHRFDMIQFHSFRAGLNGEYFSPASEITWRRNQTGSHSNRAENARANGLKNLKKSQVIETKFQPGLKSRKQDGCRYDAELAKDRFRLISIILSAATIPKLKTERQQKAKPRLPREKHCAYFHYSCSRRHFDSPETRPA